MPTFQYTTISESAGRSLTIDAPDRASAVRALTSRGQAPSSIVEVKDGADAKNTRATSGFSFKRTMSRSEMASFMRELAIAVSAGLPLVPALKTIARQGRTESQRAMLESIIDDVEHGAALSEAFERIGKPFTELIINLVAAGEAAGRLEEILNQTASLLDRDLKLRRSVVSALVYPAIVATLIVIAVIVVVTVIVPRILKSVEGQLAVLPFPTRVVQGVAFFFAEYWWLALLMLAGSIWGAARLYNTPGPRLAIDRFLLAVPMLGKALRDVAVARFTRTFGTLAAAGLPVLTCLKLTKGTLGNKALERTTETIATDVAQGATIAEPMEDSGDFPPLLIQIVSLGERTGKLDEMLIHAADAFDQKVEQSIKIVTTILPPMLIMLLAGVVGFVVLAVMLPLIELQESIG